MTTRGLAILFSIVLLIGAAREVLAHDPYSGWRQPDKSNTSCCDDTDCRPTRAYLGDDGLWRAWDGINWLTIPKSKLLPPDFAKDGRNHLCEKLGVIHCFTPGRPLG